jgi:hypothetical protein
MSTGTAKRISFESFTGSRTGFPQRPRKAKSSIAAAILSNSTPGRSATSGRLRRRACVTAAALSEEEQDEREEDRRDRPPPGGRPSRTGEHGLAVEFECARRQRHELESSSAPRPRGIASIIRR